MLATIIWGVAIAAWLVVPRIVRARRMSRLLPWSQRRILIAQYAAQVLPPGDYEVIIRRKYSIHCEACRDEGCPDCRKQTVAKATRQLPPRPPAPRGSKGCR